MFYKVCTKCNNTLPATKDNFNVMARGKYGLRSQCKICIKTYSKSRWVVVPKKTEKQCGNCKKIFPLTSEYFYTKTTKKGTIINDKPLSADSTSFRSTCKKCHTTQGYARERAKLLIKYNISSYEELDKLIYAMRTKAGMKGAYANLNVPSKRRKYQYPENATPNEMDKIRRIYKKGYELATYQDEWKKNWLKKTKENRKYVYFEEYDKLPRSLINKAVSEALTDSIVANRLGFKLEDVPQELLELKRKQLKFYRYVKEKKTNR